ncbi:hypothetical protein RRG08_020014 [Elysia crispata]|uniref:Uncharacterized protein n=1 Tax=Elysia crispata TaxID=231223 RepID=A0AAE1BAW3_9GAST|nr:hypothetical protein RRG08_020014 [Elysia crispata]
MKFTDLCLDCHMYSYYRRLLLLHGCLMPGVILIITERSGTKAFTVIAVCVSAPHSDYMTKKQYCGLLQMLGGLDLFGKAARLCC